VLNPPLVTTSVDAVIDRIARPQRFVVSGGQLAAAGVSRRAVQHRVAIGRLHRVHRGVFLVGHDVPLPLARETAALLACGPGAVLSHLTAAILWGISEPRATPVHVTVTAERRPGARAGVVVHRAAALPARRRSGLPVTTPVRTLLDLAALIPERELKWAIEEARIRKLIRPVELDAACLAHRGRRGAAALMRIAAQTGPGPTATRSEAERRLIDLIAGARLPAPRGNVRVAGHLVDLFWPAERLVAELDGYAYHAHREAFERDRRRDADLAAAGIRVVRLTWRRITAEPQAVTARSDRHTPVCSTLLSTEAEAPAERPAYVSRSSTVTANAHAEALRASIARRGPSRPPRRRARRQRACRRVTLLA
jgi:very-short-patch-repair endonuclease